MDHVQQRYPASHYVMVDDKPESVGRDESTLGEQADHGIRAPGALRARRGVKRRATAARSSDRAHRGSHDSQLYPTSRCDHDDMTQRLHDLGQSLWLDNITREILDNGTLRRYIDELSVTGLTSNPTIFDEAIGRSSVYDRSIREKARAGLSGEALFVELALEDLRRAADMFRPVFDRTGGLDGWVSMEVSPLLANDTKATLEAARNIHRLANRPNLYVKIPGTPAGVPAIEEAIFAGVSGQRHAAVLAGAIPGGCRGLYARHRAAHSRRTRSAREFGRLVVREPLGQGRQRDRCRRNCAIGWESPSRCERTARTANSSRANAGATWPPPARRSSECYGRAPAPRTRRPRPLCMSRHWRPPTPSTPCRRKRCWRSPRRDR